MSRELVACFSATGKTWDIAEKIAEIIGADTFRIEPDVPYTTADLDWRDQNSRSSIEMKDHASRPAIRELPENIDDYDAIYLGFPIWWYIAPTLINTFLEGLNLNGKMIIPFATSGSSGMGRTNDHLKDSAPGATIKEGKRFAPGTGIEEIQAWIDSLS